MRNESRSLSYCAEQVRANDPERYLCTLMAPPEVREGLFAIYAFDAEIARVRHLVSQPMAGLIRLQWWRDALDGIEAGRPLAHPVVEALHEEAWPSLRPAREALEEAIAARERELEEETPVADLAGLRHHLDASSAGIGLAALHVLGAAEAGAARTAGALIGRAWALVRLIHALPRDLGERRLLLPAALLERHGLEREALFRAPNDPSLAGAIGVLAAEARVDLEEARALRPRVPRSALPALLPALFADAHLKRLRRVGYDPFAPALARPMPAAPLRLLWRRLRGVY